MLACANLSRGRDPFPNRAPWRSQRRPFVQYLDRATGCMIGCLFTSSLELHRWDNRGTWDGERRFSARDYQEVARGWVTFKRAGRRG
jgi:hypothetical protein